MLGALRTYRWLPGLTAALLLMSSALPLVMLACLHCFMPAEAAGMHAEAGMHTEPMPCPEMKDAAATPMLGEACAMTLAATDCCTMQAPEPAPRLRTLSETAPKLLALVDAFGSLTAPRLDLPTPVFLPPEATIPRASSIGLSLLIGSLRN